MVVEARVRSLGLAASPASRVVVPVTVRAEPAVWLRAPTLERARVPPTLVALRLTLLLPVMRA